MRVLEFKISLDRERKNKIDGWLDLLRWIWNVGLREFEKMDDFSNWDKVSQQQVNRCPIQWQYRSFYLNFDGSLAALSESQMKSAILVTASKTDRNGNLFWFAWNNKKSPDWIAAEKLNGKFLRWLAGYSQIFDKASFAYQKTLPEIKLVTTEKGWFDNPGSVFTSARLTWMQGWTGEGDCTGYSCPARVWIEPTIQSPKYTGKNGPTLLVREDILQGFIARNGLPGGLTSIPSEYRYGTIKGLSLAWQEFIKSRFGLNDFGRRKPKYKPAKDAINTLVSGRSNTATIVDKDKIRLPALGVVEVPGLHRRWVNRNLDGTHSTPEIKTFRICRRASGYYLQLTGEIIRSHRLKKTEAISASEPGLKTYLTFDDGQRISNPRFYAKAQSRLQKLQIELAAKLSHNLILWLCHPDRTADDIIKICPALARSRAEKAIGLKNETDIVNAIGKSAMNRLKWQIGLSNRCRKIKEKISLLHEKIAAQRKNFIEKTSTWQIRKSGVVVVKEGMQSPALRKKARPKFDPQENRFLPNGAEIKRQVNKSLSDAGYGAFLAALDRKAKESGRQLIKVSGSNLGCPICDRTTDRSPHGKIFRCDCGYECERSQKEAISMAIKVCEEKNLPLDNLGQLTRKILEQRIAYQQNNQVNTAGKKRKGRVKSKHEIEP